MSPITPSDPNKHTMERLESLKRTSSKGIDYWHARDIWTILGYMSWAYFEPVIARAVAALTASGVNPSHHIVPRQELMGRGGGAQAPGRDYYLTRGACYLMALMALSVDRDLFRWPRVSNPRMWRCRPALPRFGATPDNWAGFSWQRRGSGASTP